MKLMNIAKIKPYGRIRVLNCDSGNVDRNAGVQKKTNRYIDPGKTFLLDV